MVLNFDKKVNFVKSQIEEEFNSLDEVQLENSFEKYKQDKRTYTFIDYYNRIVLDKENIDFGEFKRQWAIQGMTREVFNFFTENFEKLKKEIETEKDIKKFFKKYCCKVRKEASFCSKLFHTILPNEFQPVDNPIKKRFNLQKEDFIDSVLIIQQGYLEFIKENSEKIKQIRKILSKPKFSYLRIDELSDIRLVDLYIWFKENRLKLL